MEQIKCWLVVSTVAAKTVGPISESDSDSVSDSWFLILDSFPDTWHWRAPLVWKFEF